MAAEGEDPNLTMRLINFEIIYVTTIPKRHRQTERRTDRQTDNLIATAIRRFLCIVGLPRGKKPYHMLA